MNTRFLKKIVTILFIALVSIALKAQTDTIKKIVPDKLNHFSVGVNFDQYGGNDGSAFDITSPYFDISDNHDGSTFGAFRLTAGADVISGTLPGETNVSVFRYYVFNLGAMEKKVMVKQRIALFVDVGGTLILSNNQFTSQSTRWGVCILPGIEFYPSLHTGVFFEMGFADTFENYVADKLVGEPYYYINYYTPGNGFGFMVSVGYHIYI